MDNYGFPSLITQRELHHGIYYKRSRGTQGKGKYYALKENILPYLQDQATK